MRKSLWADDDGVYFGFGVKPTAASSDKSILDEDWIVDSGVQNLYPNLTRTGESGDRHLLTVGPNGSGKTRRLLVPNLFRLTNWSMVVVDVKGELSALTGAYRSAQAGHHVMVVDPFRVMERNYPHLVAKYPFLVSAGFNPVAALDAKSEDFPDEATRLAEALIQIEGKEPHWSQSAQDLVAALIMFVRLTRPTSGSLGDVRSHLGETPAKFRETVYAMLECGALQFCDALMVKVGRFADFTSENRELSSVISAALTQTRWLDSGPVRADLAHGVLDFESLKTHPTTIYLILPPRYLATHATWLRVMVTSILLPLLRSVNSSSIPVMFMLDEFAQLGHMAVIEHNIALLRGYGVKLWTVFQDLAQAKAIYKNRWESFIGNAGVVQSFAPQDVMTRDYLSQLSGQRLYWLNTGGTSSSQNLGAQASQSLGISEGKQFMPGPVFWPHGLGAMGLGQSVLFAGGRRVRSWLPDPEDDGDLLGYRQLMLAAKRDLMPPVA